MAGRSPQVINHQMSLRAHTCPPVVVELGPEVLQVIAANRFCLWRSFARLIRQGREWHDQGLPDLFPQEDPSGDAHPGAGQVMNDAGGYAWALDDWKRLDRFLVLGSEGGTYYVAGRALTLQNAAAVSRCLQADGLRAVGRIVEISEAGRAPKNDPALFALALAASLADPVTRKAALDALPRVARTGTHLFHFLQYAGGLRGWGRGLRCCRGGLVWGQAGRRPGLPVDQVPPARRLDAPRCPAPGSPQGQARRWRTRSTTGSPRVGRALAPSRTRTRSCAGSGRSRSCRRRSRRGSDRPPGRIQPALGSGSLPVAGILRCVGSPAAAPAPDGHAAQPGPHDCQRLVGAPVPGEPGGRHPAWRMPVRSRQLASTRSPSWSP